ncbi:hypothetical protein HOY80DRAFT_884941 [Tuber brumale]|nr:hypothetical protein HOY80DRAFT_884941 [Tuber brumale]
MCLYYKHIWTCGHVKYIFGKHCSSGYLFQRPCHVRSVWASIDMPDECQGCGISA